MHGNLDQLQHHTTIPVGRKDPAVYRPQFSGLDSQGTVLDIARGLFAFRR